MNSGEMFRKTSANSKETPKETKARQPNKQMVESASRRTLPRQQKAELQLKGNLLDCPQIWTVSRLTY